MRTSTDQHALIIRGDRPGHAECSCGNWSYEYVGEPDLEEIRKLFVQHYTPVCDFCSDPEVVKSYPCDDFGLRGETLDENGEVIRSDLMTMHGLWAACATCRDLIEANRWDELAQHSADSALKSEPNLAGGERDIVLFAVRMIHQRFRKGRK